MRQVMYLIANSSITMSAGKMAAQAAHAAVEAYRLTDTGILLDQRIAQWYEGGHYTKIVLEADNLLLTERYLNDRNIETVLIIDEGRTEFDGQLTPTFIGCSLVDKDSPHIKATFGEFKLAGAKERAEHKARESFKIIHHDPPRPWWRFGR